MKKRIIIIIGILMLLGVLGVSYAYFTTIIVGKGNNIKGTAAELKIVFTDGTAVNASNIEPGWETSKIFSVKNESDDIYKYNIIFKNLVNTFVTNGYLQYKITCTSGNGYTMSDYEDIPKSATASDIALATNISIDDGVTQEYRIDFIYKTTSEDQSGDMGKTLSGSLAIGEFVTRSLASTIMSKYPNVTERTDFSNIETTTKLWKTTDYDASGSFTGTSYYYTGNPDNWVSFAGKLWRIIRINGDGSVRLLYAGTGGEDGFVNGTSQGYADFNDPMYVGWKYGTSGSLASNRTNENPSKVYTTAKEWYQINIINGGLEKYISESAVYCNDRSLASGNIYSTSSSFNYAAYERINSSNPSPTLMCNSISDQFKEGFGLMTADEILFAGGKFQSENPNAYYRLNASGESSIGTSQGWWLMTPYSWKGTYISVFAIINNGGLFGEMSGVAELVRPVISLNSLAVFSEGDGTSNNPYKIVTE